MVADDEWLAHDEKVHDGRLQLLLPLLNAAHKQTHWLLRTFANELDANSDVMQNEVLVYVVHVHVEQLTIKNTLKKINEF